jgi:uncharacterized protein YbjT (DUF2867 family)
MKILVIGGTGRIGSKVVQRLRDQGHEVIAASPQTGVDILTGDGLEAAMQGANVVVDLSNSPAFDEASATSFFETAGKNILAAEKRAGVAHHVALSVVGTSTRANGYFRAKDAQEGLIRASGIPYTIVHSTQFFDFLPGIIQSATEGDSVRLPSALVQPIAADDVADAVARTALQPPANASLDIAGPERAPLSELAHRFMDRVKDSRDVIADPHALYFGGELTDETLVPAGQAWQGALDFDRWFAQSDYGKRNPSANA